MSAYIVDKDHISFLVNAAFKAAANDHSLSFSWYHNGERHELTSGNCDEVGQMLLDECVTSVSFRYSDAGITQLPGPNSAYWLIPFRHDVHVTQRADENWVAQVFKSIDCYEYESCEHPEWRSSSALVFIETLRKQACRMLPSYNKAEWGAPVVVEKQAFLV